MDRELRLLAWNRKAEELWELRTEEATGRHLLNLDIGLPLERLRPALRNCLSGEDGGEALQLEAVNRRGKAIHCAVTCSPLRGSAGDVRGAIVLMEESTGGDGQR